MLIRTDAFQELDRFTRQVFDGLIRTPAVPMDAWREEGQYVIAFDLPGVNPESIDLNVENDVLTVRAERPAHDGVLEVGERPAGVFSRQVLLADTLDPDKIAANYHAGVLTVHIPVAEHAKPRRIEIASGEQRQAITA